MTFKYDAPDNYETGGGNWIAEPGTYHLVVTGVEEDATNKDGKVLDAFRAFFTAVEGTVRDKDGNFTERDKTIDITFWNPKLTDKNEGEFARKKQGRFFIAAGLIDENVKNKSVDIDLDAATGRQVIATLEFRDTSDGKKYMDLFFADIFHIDDPAAKKFPRCEKSLSLAPASHRRRPESFTVAKKSDKSKSQQATASAVDNEVDLDSL